MARKCRPTDEGRAIKTTYILLAVHGTTPGVTSKHSSAGQRIKRQ
jgi:hypothetical protein